MELMVESFPSETGMAKRKAELEGSGFKIAFSGKTGPAADVMVRIWDSSGAAKTQAVDLVNGFVLVVEP